MPMFRAQLGTLFTAAAVAASSLMGCSGADDGAYSAGAGEEVGSLELLLSSVPSNAACLQVDVTGSRVSSKSFDLSAGSSPKFSLDRLPVGPVKVDAKAFAESCA